MYALRDFKLHLKPNATKLVLVEGASEQGFAEAYLQRLGPDPEDVAVMCFQGVDKMGAKIRAMTKLLGPDREKLEHLTGIAVLADSETNASARVDQLIGLASSLAFDHPGQSLKQHGHFAQNGRTFAFALSPSMAEAGRIEDLVLVAHQGDAMMACINQAVTCLAGIRNGPLDEKAIVQMLISAKANSSIAGIGKAFEFGLFDVMHDAYAGQRAAIDLILAT